MKVRARRATPPASPSWRKQIELTLFSGLIAGCVAGAFTFLLGTPFGREVKVVLFCPSLALALMAAPLTLFASEWSRGTRVEAMRWDVVSGALVGSIFWAGEAWLRGPSSFGVVWLTWGIVVSWLAARIEQRFASRSAAG